MKPSDNEIEMLAAGFAIQHKNGLVRFAHALLEKYASARPSTVAVEARPVATPTARAFAQLAKQYPVRPIEDAQHPDDAAVDRFADAMKAKLAAKRAAGRGGWDDKTECNAEFLSELLRGHVEKGDPLDVGNFAMMLHQRGERITSAAPQASAEHWQSHDRGLLSRVPGHAQAEKDGGQQRAGDVRDTALSNLIWAASERDKGNRIRQFDQFMDEARAAISSNAAKQGSRDE